MPEVLHPPHVTGSFEVADALMYPSDESDHELGEVLTKVKGKWDWGNGTHEAA
jgi:hypothetical protein